MAWWGDVKVLPSRGNIQKSAEISRESSSKLFIVPVPASWSLGMFRRRSNRKRCALFGDAISSFRCATTSLARARTVAASGIAGAITIIGTAATAAAIVIGTFTGAVAACSSRGGWDSRRSRRFSFCTRCFATLQRLSTQRIWKDKDRLRRSKVNLMI